MEVESTPHCQGKWGWIPHVATESSLLSSGIYKLKLKIILLALRFLRASTETRAAK